MHTHSLCVCVDDSFPLLFQGLFGYLVEWCLELSHVSPRVHHLLHHLIHGNRAARMGLFAISCVLVGHYSEHLHQEHENHEQEHKIQVHVNPRVCSRKRAAVLLYSSK